MAAPPYHHGKVNKLIGVKMQLSDYIAEVKLTEMTRGSRIGAKMAPSQKYPTSARRAMR